MSKSRILNDDERSIVTALVRGFLGEVEPPASFWQRLDEQLAGLSGVERGGVRALLALLDIDALIFAGGRLNSLDGPRVESHLARRAASSLSIVRRVVGILRTLISYSFYAASESWPAVGYGGPWLGRVEVERLPDPVLERPALEGSMLEKPVS